MESLDQLHVLKLYRQLGPVSAPQLAIYVIVAFTVVVITNIICQFLPRKKSEPPLVFHWVPFIGNVVEYGRDPCKFMMQCREKYGDIFTFVLLGRKMTVYLGIEGNDFILNGKLQDVNAEEIYSPLTTPVFGSDVVYDCPNSKLVEQKKFVKFGLTQQALESHVRLIEQEVLDYIKTSGTFKGQSGVMNAPSVLAQITIFTAGRTLQGIEVRKRLTNEFAELYHDLDLGFNPLNFVLPWAPLPHNRRRDAAHAKMRSTYVEIINERRKRGVKAEDEEPDMIWNLMQCVYRNGTPVPDKEIAHMMITILMAGQHSSSSASAWITLRLAAHPDIAEELYREQVTHCSDSKGSFRPIEHSDIERLPLLQNTIKETLRVHSSIHSILRKVKNPMPVPGTDYIVTPDKVLLASPIVTHLSEKYFPNARKWDPHRWDQTIEPDETEADMVDYGYGVVNKGTRSPYLPFGAGRHRCIGEKFAYVNLCTIIATLVRNFKFSTIDGKPTVPPTDYSSLFSRPTQPANIRWERRFPESV
ncbi:cytochrome P450 [Corynascus novoguineensis]|uniref:Cytochrome P450 n=1 Tax=Corynascus novoguineensis TaxID=1126955 RepID=A0AAN7CMZ6_9PEZI|nr:cytochrome P450 [Corynascus novoguineensis]